MTDYVSVLNDLYPGSEWTLNGDGYEGLTWLSDGPKPSQAELDAAWPQVKARLDLAEVHRLREAAYLSEADPLFFEWQRGEGTEAAWLAKVAEIKARFPLP